MKKFTWHCNTLAEFHQVEIDGDQSIDVEGTRKFIRHTKPGNSFTTNGVWMKRTFKPKVGDMLTGWWRPTPTELGAGMEAFLILARQGEEGIEFSERFNLYLQGGTGWVTYGSAGQTETPVPYYPGQWHKWLFQFMPNDTVDAYVKKSTDINFTKVGHSLVTGFIGKPCRLATNCYHGQHQPPSSGALPAATYDLEQIIWTDSEGE